jgi:hypothetical protein
MDSQSVLSRSMPLKIGSMCYPYAETISSVEHSHTEEHSSDIRLPIWLPSYYTLCNIIEIDEFDDDDMETFHLSLSTNLIDNIKHFFHCMNTQLVNYSKSSSDPLDTTYAFGTSSPSDLLVLKIKNGWIRYRTTISILTNKELKELFRRAYITSIDDINDEKSLEMSM